MLSKAVKREDDKYTLIVTTFQNLREDIPHSRPTEYSCNWSFTSKTPRQIIQECLCDGDSCTEESESNDSTEEELVVTTSEDEKEHENEDVWNDLITKRCRNWDDESPIMLKEKNLLFRIPYSNPDDEKLQG